MNNRSAAMDMDMTLHFGEREKILFSWWKTGSAAGMALSMAVVFMLCILYEAIKACRYFIAVAHVRKRRLEAEERRGMSPSAETASQQSVSFAPLLRLSGATKRLFTSYRLMQALLYSTQAVLAYLLMLVVMTFNVWLIFAVVLGESVGYFVFTGTPLVGDAINDCC